jgi:hypothetical protein
MKKSSKLTEVCGLEQRSFVISILSLILALFAVSIFLVYEYTINLRFHEIYFYIITILISIAIVVNVLNSRDLLAILALSYSLAVIKFGFLSILPNYILTPYLDAYVTYQISSAIIELSYLPSPDVFTQGAQITSSQPIQPILVAMISKIIGLDIFLVMRYFGCLFALLLPFSFYILFRIFKKIDKTLPKISSLLFCFSPFVVFFLTWGHYHNLSLIYFSIISYYVLKRTAESNHNSGFFICAFIASVALVFAHVYMEILTLILLTSFTLLLLTSPKTQRATNFVVLYCILCFMYFVYFGTRYFYPISTTVEYYFSALIEGNPSRGFSFYFGSGRFIPPFYVVALRYIGAISWLLLTFIGFGFWIWKFGREKAYLYFMLTGILGIFTATPYLFDPRFGTDLFYRSLYLWGLMASAPFATLSFFFIRKKIRNKLLKLFSVLSLIFAVNFGLISISIDFQSWNYPILGGEDVRLNYSEWASAGFFASTLLDEKTPVCGLRVGLGTVGYYARLNYLEIQPSASNLNALVPPEKWEKIKELWTPYCFLRKSITIYPEIRNYIVDKNDFRKVYVFSDVIYSCNDVFILKTR